MATLDPIIQDGELTDAAAFIFGHILGAWMTFRGSHDFRNQTFICESSDALFEALAKYEKLMIPNSKGG